MNGWWAEWGTYQLSDFLMFSARTYYRQFELLNRELWPLHLLALGMGAFILDCMLRTRPVGARVAFALLGWCWGWVAWAYHLQRYADINTGAPYFAAGFGIQAALLGWMAWRKHPAPTCAAGADRIGMLTAAIGLVVFPLLAPLDGRGWRQAEVFGFAPDPTVVVTLAVLLFWRAPWPLWVVPLLWCAASSATLMQLRAPLPWLLPALALAAVAARMADRRGRQHSR